jgi:hypothetical protein
MNIHDELIAVTINRAVTPDTSQMNQNVLPSRPMKAAGLALALVSSLAAADILHIPHISLAPERILCRHCLPWWKSKRRIPVAGSSAKAAV